MPSPTLLIVWHSQTGACQQAAEACLAGARDAAPDLNIELRHADDCGPAEVLGCGLLLVIAAENLAALSGRIKDFFDRSYYPLLDQVNGLGYASVICAGSDGSQAQRQLDRIATGLRLRRVAEPLRLLMQAQSPEAIQAPKQLDLEQQRLCRELGALLASGLQLGLF